MFERFTDRARRVVVLAQEESRLLNHSYIGTEHILLGLLNEGEGVGCQALIRHGMSLGTAREQVRGIIGEGAASPTGHIPFTPRAKKVLEMALREAIQLNHNYIGSEHILLGMVREGEGVAAQILAGNGITLEPLRETVLELIKTSPEKEEAASRPWLPPGRVRSCLHEPEWLRYRIGEVVGEGDLPSIAATFVVCANCNTTVSALPA